MKVINIKVIPNAKRTSISQEGDRLKIHVQTPAIDNRANESMIEVLRNYFKVTKGRIKILRGKKSREKIIGIDL